MRAGGEEMVAFVTQLGGVDNDMGGFAKRTLQTRAEGYVHLEQGWLQGMIESAFRDALEIPRSMNKTTIAFNDATAYMKYRSYTSRLSTFTAMTQRGITACLESLQRCRVVDPVNIDEAAESLARAFVGNFVSIAEDALFVAINVIPKTEKLASKAEYWAQGGSPIGLYATALEQIRNSLMDIDQFFASISAEETDFQGSLPPVLPYGTASSIREELRSSLSRLEGCSESGLELAAMAVASRVARTLEKEQRRPLEYSVGEEVLDASRVDAVLADASLLAEDEEVTPAFAKCCAFLEQQVASLTSALTERNLEYALSIMSNAVRLAVLSHWQRLRGPITPMGGLRLMSDARALQKCFRVCESAETELAVLVEIGNIFVLPPPKIWTLVEDGALKKLDGQILAKLLEQRPDYKTAKLKKLAAALAPDGEVAGWNKPRTAGETQQRQPLSREGSRSGPLDNPNSPMNQHHVRFSEDTTAS